MFRRLNRQCVRLAVEPRHSASVGALALLALSVTAPHTRAQTPLCPAGPCGDGSDGAYNPATSGYFKPSQFSGHGVANNVFNFTSITIPRRRHHYSNSGLR
jgi:hypothetical protein